MASEYVAGRTEHLRVWDNYNQARAEIYEQLREMHHASASI